MPFQNKTTVPIALRNWPAPAKINLFLHVTGRRPDGYHLLQTVFQFVSLYDWIDFDLLDERRIEHANPNPLIPVEDDLIIRAAKLLQQASGCSLGVRLKVEKNIPMGGGLGGGSSDAATVLLGLNRLWNLGLTRPQLAAIGLQLGADVPVFVRGFNALATGVGERLLPFDLPTASLIIIQPATSVPTVAVFKDPQLTRNTEALKIAGFPAQGQTRNIELPGRNDLEPVARRLYPKVGEALSKLQQLREKLPSQTQRPALRMSGSGACIFAWCADDGQADEYAALIRQRRIGRVFRVSGLKKHPLG
jgi:4-diphosphocytidyl-2-C-methyl-D-erythritol kinase